MIHLLADETPLSILNSLVEPVVIYDATGERVIGHYTPVDLERGKRLYAESEARIDPAEIERRKASGGERRAMSEVVASLHAARTDALPNGSPSERAPASTGRDECAAP